MENIDNNKFSRKLNELFNGNIKLSFVSKYDVIVVTKKDKCYEFKKKNIKNLLIALSDNKLKVKSLIEESFVKELSNEQCVDFRKGWAHSIARTSDGKVHCWGTNKMGVLGNGSDDRNTYQPELNRFLNREHIIDICCGRYHTLALTIKNSVYAWGRNNEGQIGKRMSDLFGCQSKPFKLNSFRDAKVKAISCGSHHSLALTKRGQVYSWGQNCFGQLGIGNEMDSNKPQLVKLSKRLFIQKISCGFRHSLLLSSDGDIYVCGWNSSGELGTGDKEINSTPMKLRHSEKFIDISSHFNHSFSAAISINSISYVWGKYGNEVITKPKQTEFNSFVDIFEHFFQITCESVEGKVIRFNDDFFKNGKYGNKFIQEESIGEGSYGEVFKVIEKNNDEFNYAVKMIKFKAEYKNEFLKELETSAIFSESNNEKIVTYFDVWLENDFTIENEIKTYIGNFIFYIQMELCDISLAEIIDEIKKDSNFYSNEILTPVGYYIASEIFIQILEGVNYLHKRNPPIIHRDLNPWNVMLKITEQDISESFVKIADLGLAIIHEHFDQSHTQDRGNSDFFAPEVRDSRKYDTRADIYSLGIVLQKLFFIDVTRDYKIRKRSRSNSFLINKYENISNICAEMTQTMVKDRSADIEEILEEKNIWALIANEFYMRKEIQKLLNFNLNNNQSYVYKLLRKIFLQ